MARGYKQLGTGDYIYRQDSRCIQREYRVEFIVFDKDYEPVKVAVRERQTGTVASPGRYFDSVFWSLAQIDEDANPRYWNGTRRVTDARGRTVKSVSFDRMIREAVKKSAPAKAAQQRRALAKS